MAKKQQLRRTFQGISDLGERSYSNYNGRQATLRSRLFPGVHRASRKYYAIHRAYPSAQCTSGIVVSWWPNRFNGRGSNGRKCGA